MTDDETPDGSPGEELSDAPVPPDDPGQVDSENPPPGSSEEGSPDGDGADGGPARREVTHASDLAGDPAGEPSSQESDDGSDPEGVTIQVESERPAREPAESRDSDGDRSATGRRREAAASEEPAERERDPERGRPAGRRAGTADEDRAAEKRLEREILDPEERIGPTEEYCRHCGAVFSASKDTCPDCGSAHPRSRDPPASTRKVPRIAAVLSLFPGLGHLYNEQFGRAAVAFFGTLALVAGVAFVGLVFNLLVTFLSLGTLSWLGTVLMVLAILFGVVFPVSVTAWDAYGQAKKLNAG